MRKRFAALVGVFLSGCVSAGAGEFEGQFELLPNPADSSGATKLLAVDFFYKDDGGLVWKANKGNITDGASIPRPLQILVGSPFDKDFVRAAVIHDHYCDRDRKNRVRDWRKTHRVFYEMLRASEVPLIKSKLMYYAVYTFGPKWGFLDQGDICGVNCINNVSPRFFEKLDYSFDTATDDEFMDVLEAIESDPEISLETLDALAEARHDQDRSFDFRPSPKKAE
jgi:hypothetical protein